MANLLALGRYCSAAFEMQSDNQIVRILLLGDDNVGKTSIIIGLATEAAASIVPQKAHDLYITGELTNQIVPALIVDTCSSEQCLEEITKEITEANVICLVYSLVDPITYQRVSEYWLPLVEKTCQTAYKPVVIVGNKADAVVRNSNEDDFDMFYIKEKFPQVEGYFRVSAFELTNIVETFQFAQKTVLHPLRPLIDLDSKKLSFSFEKALNRIFRIFDSDCDGAISWQEMLDFQKTVFKNLLYRQTLQELSDTISQNISDGLTPEGFTLSGFLFIHQLFILRGMRESVWKVLSTFGYNINLEFDEEYLTPTFNVNPGEYIQLNLSGIEYFKHLFVLSDKDKDGALSPDEFNNIFIDFSTCPFSQSDLEMCEKKPTRLHYYGWLRISFCSCHTYIT